MKGQGKELSWCDSVDSHVLSILDVSAAPTVHS